MTREDLISLCERAFVPEDLWRNRDSARAQQQLGELYALLRAGCTYACRLRPGEQMMTVAVVYKGFAYFEWGTPENMDTEEFYLPTEERLDAVGGKDWYC